MKPLASSDSPSDGQKRLTNSNSLDPIAGMISEVQLTRFNLLQPGDYDNNLQSRRQISDKENHRASQFCTVDFRERQASQFEKHNEESIWSTNVKINSSSSVPSFDALDYQDHCEPFKVVWRKLSYEVNQSSYDQLLGNSIKRLKTFLPSRSVRMDNTDESIGNLSKISQLNLQNDAKQMSDSLFRPKKRVIFKSLNGYVKSGEITAILGPSGAGKTSLLNAICGRTENYRGYVQVIGGGKRRMRMSIIPQKDYLMENLTVRENLMYSSKILNLDKNFDHQDNIMRAVKMLNLTNCLNSRAQSISGGEYKRVSIAQELLRKPDILILDEPTSGLDSLNCKHLIKSLLELIDASRSGSMTPIAIIMTIHQPDIDVFKMFQHVYCMARGGRVIFDGRPSDVVGTLQNYSGLTESQLPGLWAKNSIGANPANLLIEIASGQMYGQEPIERLAKFQQKIFDLELGSGDISSTLSTTTSLADINLLNATNSSKNFHKRQTNDLVSFSIGDHEISRLSTSSAPLRESKLIRDKRLTFKVDHSGHFWQHTALLAKRSFVSTIRDPLMTLISLLFHLTVPFVMWFVYSKKVGSTNACPPLQRSVDLLSMISNETMRKIEVMQDELDITVECSTMYFLTTYSFSMCSLSVAALAFPLSMHVLLKEVRNGWYRLPSFVIAKTIANFPFEVIFPTLSIVLIYSMLGMPSSYMEWRLFSTALVMALVTMISHSQGLIFGALCMDSVQTAIFLASASSLPLTLLSGFTARIHHMPEILQKLSWFSLYRYSTDAINIIRFGYGTCPCDEDDDAFLKAGGPKLTGIPEQLAPMMTYYLTNSASREADNVTDLMGFNVTNSVRSSYDLSLSPSGRNEILNKLESNEIDLFGKMADLISRTFSYGRAITDCKKVRAQILFSAGTPEDELLPYLFLGLLVLLVASKLILFAAVNYRIGKRI